jgi:hypothetical protein
MTISQSRLAEALRIAESANARQTELEAQAERLGKALGDGEISAASAFSTLALHVQIARMGAADAALLAGELMRVKMTERKNAKRRAARANAPGQQFAKPT